VVLFLAIVGAFFLIVYLAFPLCGFLYHCLDAWCTGEMDGANQHKRDERRVIKRQRRDIIKHGVFQYDASGKLVQVIPGGREAKKFLKRM